MASSSSTGVASFSANVVLGRSLAHRASLQLLASPAPAHQAALPLFVQAAQAFALAVRQAPSAADKAAVQRDFKAALEKAEACKNVLRARETEGGVRRHAGKGRCDPGELVGRAFLRPTSCSTADPQLRLPCSSQSRSRSSCSSPAASTRRGASSACRSRRPSSRSALPSPTQPFPSGPTARTPRLLRLRSGAPASGQRASSRTGSATAALSRASRSPSRGTQGTARPRAGCVRALGAAHLARPSGTL